LPVELLLQQLPHQTWHLLLPLALALQQPAMTISTFFQPHQTLEHWEQLPRLEET
jgi:hypothetical protein